MPALTRRTLMAGAAATGALAATATLAQDDKLLADHDLSAHTILITGCSSGFGYLGALHYARSGAKVFATMRNLPRPEGAQLEDIAAQEGLDLTVLELDVLDETQVDSAMTAVDVATGGQGIDVLINNAGIGITSPVEVQDMEATRLIFDTNVFGCHRMVRAFLPNMRAKKRGLIFQISSQLGRVILPYSGHYSATKFALEAMGEQLAYELVPHGVDVSIIEPGGYPTDVWVNRNGYSAALKERASAVHTSGYPRAVARMGQEDGSGRSADPMDVPRAIAEIIAMPPGTRPLRTPVHPGRKPQIAINALTAKVQTEWLGNSGYGPLINGVHNR